MSLKKQIEADIKAAMLAKEKEKLTALRAVKSQILLAETEHSAGSELTGDAEIKLLTKMVKQRKESYEVYEQQGRSDLAAKEKSEYEIIQEYLPKQLSDEELKAAIGKIIETSGASSIKDMGKVMGLANKQLAGKAEGKKIASMVKTLLS
ncbi:MAG TPA: GatB/YqeY domain-containing protein [Cyclobacteriaceae bacterium]